MAIFSLLNYFKLSSFIFRCPVLFTLSCFTFTVCYYIVLVCSILYFGFFYIVLVPYFFFCVTGCLGCDVLIFTV